MSNQTDPLKVISCFSPAFKHQSDTKTTTDSELNILRDAEALTTCTHAAAKRTICTSSLNRSSQSGLKLNAPSFLCLYLSGVSEVELFLIPERKSFFPDEHRHPPGLARISSAACRATPERSSWSLAPSILRRRFPLSASSCPSARSAPTPRCAECSPRTRSLQREEDRRGVFAEVTLNSLHSR